MRRPSPPHARRTRSLTVTSKASNASGSTLRPCHKLPRQAQEMYVYSTPLSTQTAYIGHASSQETLRDKRRASSQSFHDTHAEHEGSLACQAQESGESEHMRMSFQEACPKDPEWYDWPAFV